MRCDQYIGLNDWASNMLNQYKTLCFVEHIAHPFGNEHDPNPKSFNLKSTEEMVPEYNVESIGTIHGAWDEDVANLNRYIMPDGLIFQEFIQASPWSSGPCYFIALKDEYGNVIEKSLWTDEEIANA